MEEGTVRKKRESFKNPIPSMRLVIPHLYRCGKITIIYLEKSLWIGTFLFIYSRTYIGTEFFPVTKLR